MHFHRYWSVEMVNVQRIEIPTPFSVGSVNCYLFPNSEVTVIDPGPATDDAYNALHTQLAQNGVEISDIDRVLVTHPHTDHCGLVNRITEEAGATVFAHADATLQMEDPGGYFERAQAVLNPFLRSMGIPDDIVSTVIGLLEPSSEFQAPAPVDYELTEGDHVDVGVDLNVVYTPGHSPGSICFLEPTDGAIFTGDHILPNQTPNPLLSLSPNDPNQRTRSLPTYIASLRKLRMYNTDIGYGGHGELIRDVPMRITEIIGHHINRKEDIADLLAQNEPTTAFELMEVMFPSLSAGEMFLGMSEVIGHLDWLEDEGRVQGSKIDGTIHYQLQ